MDKEKFKKINWNRLEKHPIVEYFLQNPITEDLFRGNLRAYREDPKFLDILNVRTLGEDDIDWLTNQIKDKFLTKKSTRRSFLCWLIGGGTTAAVGIGTAKYIGIWPFKPKLPDKVLETKLLADFLTYTEKDTIDKKKH